MCFSCYKTRKHLPKGKVSYGWWGVADGLSVCFHFFKKKPRHVSESHLRAVKPVCLILMRQYSTFQVFRLKEGKKRVNHFVLVTRAGIKAVIFKNKVRWTAARLWWSVDVWCYHSTWYGLDDWRAASWVPWRDLYDAWWWLRTLVSFTILCLANLCPIVSHSKYSFTYCSYVFSLPNLIRWKRVRPSLF